jgi:2-oxoglutarate ferredoxin oxidoreductase subunit alpha
MDVFHRYVDENGDGIAARTLPGTHPKGAYFTRGSGHNMYGAYTEDAGEYKQVVDRLLRKWETAKEYVPKPVTEGEGNSIGFLTIGSCDQAVREARDILAESGVKADYMRVRAFPFNQDVQDFLDSHDRVYVIEQNRDAQLRGMLRLEAKVSDDKICTVLHYNGLPMTAGFVIDAVNEDLARGVAA